MDSKDVEEIFKVVLTDEASQESQDPNNSNMLLLNNNNMGPIPQAQNGVVMVQNQNHTPIMSPSRSGKLYFAAYLRLMLLCYYSQIFRLTNQYVSWNSPSSSFASCSYQYAFTYLPSNVSLSF